MKFSNSMNSLLTNFETHKNSKLVKLSSLRLMFKKPYLSKYLDCVESSNSYILFIDVTNSKLHLINFVYFFQTPVTYQADYKRIFRNPL